MLPLPPFELHRPSTVAEAVQLWSTLDEARYIAGGTDLLPNLKHHLDAPRHLVALGGLEELRQLSPTPSGGLRIGAAVPLHTVATSTAVQAVLPALAQAAELVAGPQHRRMGTLGGNVLLDTRCLYYNQSRPWRQALGGCLKADGSWCHVIGSAKGCVAAQSSDTVPILVAADAILHLQVPGEEATPRQLPIRALYGTDGRRDRMHALPPGALLCAVEVPAPSDGQRSVYRKVRHRGAVDFPQLGVAAIAHFDAAQRCTGAAVVLGALLPRPTLLRGTEDLVGTSLDDATIAAFAVRAQKQGRPQTQVHGAPIWRRAMIEVEVRRALRDLRPAERGPTA